MSKSDWIQRSGMIMDRIDIVESKIDKLFDGLSILLNASVSLLRNRADDDELLVQISRAVDNLEASLLINCEKELEKIREGYGETKSVGIDPEIMMEPIIRRMDEKGISYKVFK